MYVIYMYVVYDRRNQLWIIYFNILKWLSFHMSETMRKLKILWFTRELLDMQSASINHYEKWFFTFHHSYTDMLLPMIKSYNVKHDFITEIKTHFIIYWYKLFLIVFIIKINLETFSNRIDKMQLAIFLFYNFSKIISKKNILKVWWFVFYNFFMLARFFFC